MKSFLTFLCITFILLNSGSCKKDNNTTVPYVAVDIYLYTSNPSFFNLSVVGGWVYVTGGNRGILIYRKTSTDFMTYDRNCTYQPTDACATVVVDNTNIIATDTCCHSKFSLYDGSVIHGPAGFALKAYNNTFDGNVLHIYN